MKKGILVVWACLLSAWCLGQEPVKEFTDANGRVVKNEADARGYRMVVKDAEGELNGPITQYDSLGRKTLSGAYAAGKRQGLFEHYHPDGQRSSKREYLADEPVGTSESWYENGKPQEVGRHPADTAGRRGKHPWEVYRIESFWDSTGAQLVKDGSGDWYGVHDNGKVRSKGAYRAGMRVGDWTFYDEEGRLTNTEQYVNGRLEKGLYQGPKGERFTYTSDTYEMMPEYPGGLPALAGFLSANLRYPKEARRRGASGTVFVGFVVGSDGKIRDVNVLQGIGYGCDEEAARVVGLMPSWRAGRQQGRPVAVRYALPIRFVMQ